MRSLLYPYIYNYHIITPLPFSFPVVKNAFRLATAAKRHYCQAHSREAKINFIGRLESAIIAAVKDYWTGVIFPIGLTIAFWSSVRIFPQVLKSTIHVG